MYQYRQALLSMRRGDTDRQIAQTRLLGRPKLAQLRQQALERGWLEPDSLLPRCLSTMMSVFFMPRDSIL